MAVKNILFIEGESNSPNGDLRHGFSKLLEQQLKGKLPKIILSDGKTSAIDKFKTNQLEADLTFLLIDLDRPEAEIENDLREHELLPQREYVFYMVQEMEAWFLSQPDVLNNFYGVDGNRRKVSDKIVKKHPALFPHPDEELIRVTKHSSRGSYHKIKHAVELLKLLDARKLADNFPDFKRLITKLK